MESQASSVAESPASLPPGLPPEWHLSRDVACPTCGYNLRMLHAPRCPECGAEFRWQALLHIACPRCAASLRAVDGDMCPLCCLALDWKRLLDDADPALLDVFEYSGRPIRRGLDSWVAVLRPMRFWEALPIEAPPMRRRLRALSLASLAIMATGLTLMAITNSRVRGWSPPFEPFDDFILLTAITALTPPIVAALALPLFNVTLSRFQIRRDQLLRATAYGFSGLSWIGAVVALASSAGIVANVLRTASWTVAFNLGFLDFSTSYPLWTAACVLVALAVAVFTLLWWPRFLYVSLREYLRLDQRNARALFISTVIIAVLAMLAMAMPLEDVAHLVALFIAPLYR